MPTCWCRAGTSRYWRARAASSPAPGHRRDPRSRTARSRRRGDWAPRRERLCGPTRPWALMLVLVPIAFETIKQIGKPIWHTLTHHVVVHGAKLLAETGLHLAAKLSGLGTVLLVAGGRGFHWFLLSHGFALVVHRFNPKSLRPDPRRGYPRWRSVKTHEWTYGSTNRELFSNHHVRGLVRL